MALRLGNTEISALRLGAATPSKVILGDVQVWPVAPPSGYDPNAQTYITAVETADGQALETEVKDAINTLVTGIKADGYWSDIHTLVCTSDARTLAGAVIAIKGNNAGTLTNITSGDLTRGLGIAGNGSTKMYDSTVPVADYGSTTSGWLGVLVTTWATNNDHQTIVGVANPGTSTSRINLGGSASNYGPTDSSIMTLVARIRTNTSASTPAWGSPSIGYKMNVAAHRTGDNITIKTYSPTESKTTTITAAALTGSLSGTHSILGNSSTEFVRYFNGTIAVYIFSNGGGASADAIMARLSTFVEAIRTFLSV